MDAVAGVMKNASFRFRHHFYIFVRPWIWPDVLAWLRVARGQGLDSILGLFPVAILLFLPFNHMLASVAVASHIIGLFVSRWLFLAEAEHVVGLFYDKR